MILKRDDPVNQAFINAVVFKRYCSMGDGFYLVDYNPTVENMVIDLFHKVKDVLPEGVTLEKIVLYETDTSFAEITR